MRTITIKIGKKNVMGVVEGLSATIAQHNPDVDFQALWASDSEEAKLDIYYREAITDLENFLARFSSSTTQQFDLQAVADDFTITIKTLASWPPRLSGVLTNQVQNYLVHAILAGWLSDFPEMRHTDYASMGASDLDAIKEVLLKKDFSFAEVARKGDDTSKGGATVGSASSRNADSTAKGGSSVGDTASRNVDSTSKGGSSATETSSRNADSTSKGGSSATETSKRGTDNADKQLNALDASSRNEDGTEKGGSSATETSKRGTDNADKQLNALDASSRNADETEKGGSSATETSERGTDDADKQLNVVSAEARGADDADKQLNTLDADARGTDDADKQLNTLDTDARAEDDSDKQLNTLNVEERNADVVAKDAQSGTAGAERNKDFVSQHFHQDFVDWSGGRPPYELW